MHTLFRKEFNNVKRHFGMRFVTAWGRAVYPALYPIFGIWFFILHPTFWSLFKARLIPLLFLSLLVYTLLFMFAFLPQAAFLAIIHRPAAFVSAMFLVLGEGAVVVALLFEAFLVDETLVDVFDSTLLAEAWSTDQESIEQMLTGSRIIFAGSVSPVKALGPPTKSASYGPFSIKQIVEFILCLPLNLLPYVGAPIFLFITGRRAGPLQHWRYFKLIGKARKERRKEIKSRRWQYTWFGVMYLTLQLVPVLSMFFLLTSACGSALWAKDIEAEKKRNAQRGVRDEEAAEEHDGTLPHYRDTAPAQGSTAPAR